MDSSSSTSSEESLPIQRKRMKVDESDADSSECSEFIEDGERMEEDENSDPESHEGGAEVSFVSNGTTLIAQSPTRTSVTKRCSRCQYFEGARKSGEVVVFNVNPRNQKKYAKCRSCMKNNDETNAKVCLPHHQANHSQFHTPTNCIRVSPTCCSWWRYRGEYWLILLFMNYTNCLDERRCASWKKVS
jgi:hypothetical protein